MRPGRRRARARQHPAAPRRVPRGLRARAAGRGRWASRRTSSPGARTAARWWSRSRSARCRTTAMPLVVAAIRDIGAYPRVKQALQRAHYSERPGPGRPPGRRHARSAGAARPRAGRRRRRRCRSRWRWSTCSSRTCSSCASPAASAAMPGEAVGAARRQPPGHARSASCSPRAGRSIVADYRRETRFSVPPAYLEAGLTSALGGAALGPRPHHRRSRRALARSRAASATTRCAFSNRSPTCWPAACSARSRRRRSTMRSGSRASASSPAASPTTSTTC